MIGTPQTRWREMHQSGRVAIMFEMRSSPQAGIQWTLRDRFERALRRSLPLHADEPLLGGTEDGRVVAAPAVRVAVLEFLRVRAALRRLQQVDDDRVASQTVLADQFFGQTSGSALGVKETAAASTGLYVVIPYCWPVRKSSWP